MAGMVEIRDLTIGYGDTAVLRDINIRIEPGEFLVLVGPSGCGKSTLLNAVAGLAEVSSGSILIGDRDVTGLEPKDRQIGMVFQSYALYPNMTVEQNLSFGLKVAGMPREAISARVADVAAKLHLGALLGRKPAALSGGQRQRVAIGRVLVRQVELFLFDEPLSNLDAQLRNELRVEIKKLHQRLKNTIIYVTHDQVEAMTLADRIVVLQDGKIQQVGTPLAIFERPLNKFVAGFIGSPRMNFIDGELRVANGRATLVAGGVDIPLGTYPFQAGRPLPKRATLGLRPEHLVLEGATTARAGCGQVALLEPMGADTLLWTEWGGAPIAIRVASDHAMRVGDQIGFRFHHAHVSLFDGDSGGRL